LLATLLNQQLALAVENKGRKSSVQSAIARVALLLFKRSNFSILIVYNNQ
jgi:hypothetical protein